MTARTGRTISMILQFYKRDSLPLAMRKVKINEPMSSRLRAKNCTNKPAPKLKCIPSLAPPHHKRHFGANFVSFQKRFLQRKCKVERRNRRRRRRRLENDATTLAKTTFATYRTFQTLILKYRIAQVNLPQRIIYIGEAICVLGNGQPQISRLIYLQVL